MRRTGLVVCASGSGMLLIGLVVLALAWIDELATLDLLDSATVQIVQASLSHEEITYHLPTNQNANDLYARLVQHGWVRDRREETLLMHDLGSNNGFVIFWRDQWFGLAPEVITVRSATPDQHAVDIELSRCITLGAWTRCR